MAVTYVYFNGIGLRRVEEAIKTLKATDNEQGGASTPILPIWQLLDREPANEALPAAEQASHLTALLLQLDESAAEGSRHLCDLLVPTHEQADAALASAVRLVSAARMNLTPIGVAEAVSNCDSGVEALALAIAAESKVRSFGLGNNRQRQAWLEVARDALQRAFAQQGHSAPIYKEHFPLLLQVRQDLVTRLDPDAVEYYVGEARWATKSLRFADATDRLRDGLAHLPDNTELWNALVETLLTEFELGVGSARTDWRASSPARTRIDESFAVWLEHCPQNTWQRELLTARYHRASGDLEDALAAMERARRLTPASEVDAVAFVRSRQAALLAEATMEGRQ